MQHIFDIQIDPFLETAQICLDQRPVSPQSQLRNCSTDNFFSWYRDLPDLLYAELNDEYLLHVTASEAEYLLLKTVFAGNPACRGLSHTAPASSYSIEQRFQWLTEAAKAAAFPLPVLPPVSIVQAGGDGQLAQAVQAALPPFYRTRSQLRPGSVNVWLAENPSALAQISAGPDDLILCEPGGFPGGIPSAGTQAVFAADKTRMPKLAAEWAEAMIAAPYLAYCQDAMKPCVSASDFIGNARLRMLTGNEPSARLLLPDRLETGHSAGIQIEEFPPSPLSLQISDPSVLAVNGSQLKALKSGTAEVRLLDASGRTLDSRPVQVYFVSRVTSIRLTASAGNQVLEGVRFSVTADFIPANAVDTGNAVWTVSPAGCLRELGHGNFLAQSPGNCRIQVAVGKIVQNLDVQILPLPRSMDMQTQLKMKTGSPPEDFQISLQPAGSACREIQICVADASVVRWDSARNQVIPVSEGKTTLEACALDAAGKVVCRESCQISVAEEIRFAEIPNKLKISILFGLLEMPFCRTGWLFLITMLGVGFSMSYAHSCWKMGKWKIRAMTRKEKIWKILSVALVFFEILFFEVMLIWR